jgi:hypothetical protein
MLTLGLVRFNVFTPGRIFCNYYLFNNVILFDGTRLRLYWAFPPALRDLQPDCWFCNILYFRPEVCSKPRSTLLTSIFIFYLSPSKHIVYLRFKMRHHYGKNFKVSKSHPSPLIDLYRMSNLTRNPPTTMWQVSHVLTSSFPATVEACCRGGFHVKRDASSKVGANL